MQITVSSIIIARPNVVFDRVMDVENWVTDITAIQKVEILTTGPIAVGTKIRETRKIFGQSSSEVMMISEIKPDRKLVMTAHSNGADYRTEHIFDETDGGTKMTLNFSAQPMNFTAWMMSPVGLLMSGSLKKMLEADMADLKSAIERAN